MLLCKWPLYLSPRQDQVKMPRPKQLSYVKSDETWDSFYISPEDLREVSVEKGSHLCLHYCPGYSVENGLLASLKNNNTCIWHVCMGQTVEHLQLITAQWRFLSLYTHTNPFRIILEQSMHTSSMIDHSACNFLISKSYGGLNWKWPFFLSADRLLFISAQG